MSDDPRGPIRTITRVEPAHCERPHCSLVTLDCGHVREMNPVFHYKVGDPCHCLPCGEPDPAGELIDTSRLYSDPPDPHAAAMAAGMSAVEKALERPANKQTPGPWFVLGRENRLGDIGVGPEGRSACPLAIVLDCGKDGEARDNASLIAAAPELADVLEACRGLFDGWGVIRENLGVKGRAQYDALVSLIDNALRKAGRS